MPVPAQLPTAPAPAQLPTVPVPAQLPAVPADFTGRESERHELYQQLAVQDAVALPTVVITGSGGVGKSTLAVRVAHDLASSYPDGQLFVQLHGATTTPTMPDAVLARFLSALGDSEDDLPRTVEERSERYRSLVAGRRLLVVLDDAANEAQVRPLLPGSSSCGVLITSRSRLSGLAGAVSLELDVLPPTQALDLLTRIVGRERIDAELDQARRLVQQCGYLALAVRIVGTRLVDRRHWTVATLVRRLEQEHRRLDELRVGDQEVRASIALSYGALDASAQIAARRLGFLGLPDFASWVVAPVLDTDPETAEAVLERLLDAQFVRYSRTDEVGQVRYQMHDLVRLFTSERALVEDEPGQRAEAVRRLLSGWHCVVEQIGDAYPSGGLVLDSSPADTADTGGDGPAQDMAAVVAVARERPRAWFSAEQHAIIASIERAAVLDLDHEAARLAVALATAVFSTANFFEAWARTHEVALDVVRRTGNRAAEAALLNGLGQLRYEQDRLAEARTYHMQALAAFREVGDPRGEAVALAATGTACREQGYLPEALHFLTQARDLLRTLDDIPALASVSRLIGTVLLEQGDFAGAHAALRDALTAFRRLGGRRGEALTLRTIGLVHRAEGDYERAYELSTQARTIFREIGDDLFEAYSVQAMAKAQLRLGRWAEASDPLLEALRVCRASADRYGEALCLRTLGELHLAAQD
ncbi:MAG: tetratricopeptide repeat protein, partial [Dactylosporangium sp.]|nr:tetratricopeptide repeat protein [Dactylosporangium sp.]